jgi:hypothetical protein
MTTKTFSTRAGNLSIATATADDLLSGGNDNITRYELTSTSRNGAPLAIYLRKLPAAIGLQFAGGDVDTTQAMVQAIGNVLCNETGQLLFEGRLDQVANMPMDVFQELSGLVNEKILGGSAAKGEGETIETVDGTDASACDTSIAATEGEV